MEKKLSAEEVFDKEWFIREFIAEEHLSNDYKIGIRLMLSAIEKKVVEPLLRGEAVSDAVEFAEWKKDYRWLKSIRKWVSDKDDLLTTQELYDNFKMTTQTYKTSNNE